MSNVSAYSTTAASNNSAPPNGFPEGMSPGSLNDGMREVMAGIAKWYKDTQGTLVTAGSSNAYTLTTNNAHATLAAQSMIVFRADRANTGAATLNVDGLGAKSIRSRGAALAANALLANDIYAVSYNATDDAYDLHTTPAAFNLLVAGGLTYPTADGTALQVLATDGSGNLSFYDPGNPASGLQTFTSSGTWTKPAGTEFVYVEAWGGGGGGGNNTGSGNVGGGSGGEYVCKIFRASEVGATETVTIGAGGAGGSTGAANAGADGGSTTFGALLTAYGGNGGPTSTTSFANIPRSLVDIGTSNSVLDSMVPIQAGYGGGNVAGGDGGNTIYGGGGGGGNVAAGAGDGGVSEFGGNGGAAGDGGAAGSAGTAPAGGGGAADDNGGGGAGARGEMRVWTW